MTVLTRYITQETGKIFLAVASVLTLITSANTFAGFFEGTAQGLLPSDILLSVLGYGVLISFTQILSPAMFLALIFVFSRMYRDNEIPAMHACGIGYARLYRCIAPLIIATVFMHTVIEMWILPQVINAEKILIHEASNRPDFVGIKAGRFIENRHDNRVLFAESLSADQQKIENLFIQQTKQGDVHHVITAEFAMHRLSADSRERLLVLYKGRYYIGIPGTAKYQLMEFDQLSLRLPQPTYQTYGGTSSAIAGHHLPGSQNIRHQAEFQSRLGSVISTLLLLILALPLSYSEPRKGRMPKAITAILLYFIYGSLIALFRRKLESGAIPMFLGTWPVHILFLGLIVFLFARYYGWSWILRRDRQ